MGNPYKQSPAETTHKKKKKKTFLFKSTYTTADDAFNTHCQRSPTLLWMSVLLHGQRFFPFLHWTDTTLEHSSKEHCKLRTLSITYSVKKIRVVRLAWSPPTQNRNILLWGKGVLYQHLTQQSGSDVTDFYLCRIKGKPVHLAVPTDFLCP